ncbi:MAG: peptide chain release factor 1 [Chloroflexota bacterium]
MTDRLGELSARHQELSALLARAETATDRHLLVRYGRELARLAPIVDALRGRDETREALTSARGLLEDADPEVRAMARDEVEDLEGRLADLESELRRLLVPRDPNDERDVILEIRAGTGGDEASLFATDLYRMYQRYAEQRRWRVDLLSTSESPSGGYKEVIAEVAGDGAYSRLKFESGVHRVQRVPVTESSGRIHTSTATVAVLPEADEVEVDIDEGDLRIETFRSSGPGGQSVNTTDSAVRITHLPTGMAVAIQDEKSQHKNRAKALSVLRARLLEAERARQAEARGEARRAQVGTGERSEKIRTYNFPADRVTDHRIGLTVHNLPGLLAGDLDRVIEPLRDADQAARLAAAGANASG